MINCPYYTPSYEVQSLRNERNRLQQELEKKKLHKEIEALKQQLGEQCCNSHQNIAGLRQKVNQGQISEFERACLRALGRTS